ncbi:MAG: chorismate synthase [Candidatus Omnitrophica bacterium]|nr:chorismate synthase [Candidatus Omnitrophota bacterium]
MAGNTFGQLFRITTFGESHGAGIGVVIDGVSPNLDLTEKDIQIDLDRRRPGQSKITTQRQEKDTAEILSGVFEGKTTGAPIAILIRNSNQRSQDYSDIKDVFRPGHADYTFLTKFGIRDYRGGGRSSGRETAGRVAAGAIAKKILAKAGIKITAYTLSVGHITAKKINFNDIEKNIVRSPDLEVAQLMINEIERARKDMDSVGGIVEAVVQGCPAGLGDPVFDKLNAQLAHALLSIGTIRGIEFGDGFGATTLRASEHNDAFGVSGKKVITKTNHAGGILGGISTGQDIVLRVAVKPPSSIAQEQETVNTQLKSVKIRVKGRHDPCICPRVVPVVEAMMAITLVDALLIQKSIKLS